VSAIKECRFKDQIVPVELPAKKRGAPPVFFTKDESPREDSTIEALRGLKPAFKKDGTVTAGNAPGVNDGARPWCSCRPLRQKTLGWAAGAHCRPGRQRHRSRVGDDGAGRNRSPALAEDGWKNQDVDLYEINEAFSVAALGVTRELGLDLNRVNVNGGAVALGHPIGASGARILTTLLYEMIRRDVHKGIAALCLGGGNAWAWPSNGKGRAAL